MNLFEMLCSKFSEPILNKAVIVNKRPERQRWIANTQPEAKMNVISYQARCLSRAAAGLMAINLAGCSQYYQIFKVGKFFKPDYP